VHLLDIAAVYKEMIRAWSGAERGQLTLVDPSEYR
jgi:hypothetical protein